MEKRVVLKFAYLGKYFDCFAKSENANSVESAILNALNYANINYNNFQYASRTDKHVSALGNVLAITTTFPIKNLIPALNAYINYIYFYSLKEVPLEFNPRYANLRHYRYFLTNNNLDVELMSKCAEIFIGVHDFRNFADVDENVNTMREIYSIELHTTNTITYIDIKGRNFLRKMVRKIAMALKLVGEKKQTLQELMDILECKVNKKIGSLSPEALILMDVNYEFKFEIPEKVNLRKVISEYTKSLVEKSILEILVLHL